VAWTSAVEEAERQRGREAAAELGMALEEERRVEPFEGARDRHLWVFRKIAPTPDGYPRRPGMAAKRPLGASS
jgi:16S rRNA (guanine527-N7)-methyltransferase